MVSHFYDIDENNVSNTLNNIINDLDRWLKWGFI
jgi:hypothetical protein